jgi:hypothetical protein
MDSEYEEDYMMDEGGAFLMKLRFKTEYQKYHPWFGFWSSKKTPQIRDLGDYVIWVFKLQITIWVNQ